MDNPACFCPTLTTYIIGVVLLTLTLLAVSFSVMDAICENNDLWGGL